MNTKIAILGLGRMGREIRKCVVESENLQLAGIWVRGNIGTEGGIDEFESGRLADVLSAADVALDFTLPLATDEVIEAVSGAGIPLVCGVSGLADTTRKRMVEAATSIPVLYDSNMSLGIAVLHRAVRLAGAALGDQFETEIHETHHVHKVDAPSGTALQLGETLAASRGQSFSEVCHYPADGDQVPPKGSIHFEVTRRGEVPGEHTVLFGSPDESLAFMHKVSNRRVFAVGALRAAAWLLTQPPGLYSMQDLVA